MRTRRNIVLGVAAAALAVTACGIAASNSGGTPGMHVARVSAQHAPMSTSATNLEDLAGVKRHAMWVAGDFAPVQRPRADTSWFMAQRDLAKVKLGIELNAAQQPGAGKRPRGAVRDGRRGPTGGQVPGTGQRPPRFRASAWSVVR